MSDVNDAAMGGDDDPQVPEVALVTGFPRFSAKRMISKILASDAEARVIVLARPKFEQAATAFLASLGDGGRARAELLIGDVCDMDLGLAGSEYRRLVDEVTTVHHLASIYYLGVDKRTARHVNVEGTRGVLEFAREASRLRRLCHYSTAQVSGKRKGVILEEELDAGQSFHNIYEETKFEAEKLARSAQRHLPITILRPGMIVGDSETGEIDKFDGPYYLMVLIATNTLNVRVPLPGRGSAPMHLVPIDYVIDAAYALSLDVRAAGKTLHLTDPNPLSARRVYELVAEHSQAKSPRGFIPTGLARTVLRTPGLEKLARAPVSFLDSFDDQVFYNSRHAASLLARHGIRCPAFDTYVENLVRYVRSRYDVKRQRAPTDEVADPLD
jgi:thioester reductase-like protein